MMIDWLEDIYIWQLRKMNKTEMIILQVHAITAYSTFIGVIGGGLTISRWEISNPILMVGTMAQSLDDGTIFRKPLQKPLKNHGVSASECPLRKPKKQGLFHLWSDDPPGVIQQFVQVLIAHDENIDPERRVTVRAWGCMGSTSHPAIHPSIHPSIHLFFLIFCDLI